MSEIATLAAAIFRQAANRKRILVALAGPPGAGKSTLAERLRQVLPEGQAFVVPMDGFHFDDKVLLARGLRGRKGAPETFDFHGFEALLQRIRRGEAEIAIPVFDRGMELSRAGAEVIPESARFILVEGNYLLLDEEPWRSLTPLFDFTIFIEIDRAQLERRLLERWALHGKTPEEARAWIDGNDMPNIERVNNSRLRASLVMLQQPDSSVFDRF